jgi:hypothetical protein
VFAADEHAHHGHGAYHGEGHGDDSHTDLTGVERQCPIGLALTAALLTAPESSTLATPKQAPGPTWRLAAVFTNTPDTHYLSRG